MKVPTDSPWGKVRTAEALADGVWLVTTESNGGICLSNSRLAELSALLGYQYQTVWGEPEWFEKTGDISVPLVGLGIRSHYVEACKHLRLLAVSGLDSRYSDAYDALVAQGCILDGEKIKRVISREIEQ